MSVKLESSLTDLMTSLAVIFILLMVANINNVGQFGKKDIKNIRNELLYKYEIDCKPVVDDPWACVITFPDKDFMFEPGSHEITIQGKDSRILKVKLLNIMKTLMTNKNRINGIYIDGYTDTDGVDETNLELSQRRSLAVGQFLLNNVYANNPEYKKKDLFKYKKYLLEWLYLNGRGEQNPFKFNKYHYQFDSKDVLLVKENFVEINIFSPKLSFKKIEDLEKAQSRRVELTIRVKSTLKEGKEDKDDKDDTETTEEEKQLNNSSDLNQIQTKITGTTPTKNSIKTTTKKTLQTQATKLPEANAGTPLEISSEISPESQARDPVSL